MRVRNPVPKVAYDAELPRRLRELRLEMGMTLADVVPIVGVAQKGVISNWEATNQRRRIPELSSLFALQRFYGVSLDYLVGNPKAERDSPEVRAGKRAVRESIKTIEAPELATPSERARAVLLTAFEIAPEAFFLDRAAAYLRVSVDRLSSMLRGEKWPMSTILSLASFLGVEPGWFLLGNK